MKLDDVLLNPLKIHKKTPKPGFIKLIKMIRRNEFDPSDGWCAHMKIKAIKAGLIDEDLNILQEDYDARY